MYDDNDAGGGCLTVLIIAAIFAWISDNWVTIVLVIAGIIALAAVILGIRSYQAKKPEREAAARKKAEQEAAEKARKERETYDRYFAAQESAHLYGRLDSANAIVRKLFAETDVDKRRKILDFFDKYLPLITEIIEAKKHGGTDADDAFRRFTETVKAFSRNLYQADDVIDANKAVLESMAIRDGLYDPYKDVFDFNAEDDESEILERPHKVVARSAANSEFDLEMTVQDRLDEAIMMDDFDTIREMLDSGVIDESDVDDDVLEKVETYT